MINVKRWKKHNNIGLNIISKKRGRATSPSLCPCSICKGHTIKSRRTINRHMQEDRIRVQEFQEGLEETSFSTEGHDPSVPEIQTDEHSYDAYEDVHGNEEHESEELTLERTLLTKIIQLQSLLDSGNVSITLQTQILSILFGGAPNMQYLDHQKHSISSLLRSLPPDRDGKVEGCPLPKSFRDLVQLYRKMGMVKPKRYRLCMGSTASPHYPLLLPISMEDDPTEKCQHQKTWGECSLCKTAC